jgi:hypothetical protein
MRNLSVSQIFLTIFILSCFSFGVPVGGESLCLVPGESGICVFRFQFKLADLFSRFVSYLDRFMSDVKPNHARIYPLAVFVARFPELAVSPTQGAARADLYDNRYLRYSPTAC